MNPMKELDKVAVKSDKMPTRTTAPLHKDRSDQAILLKWYMDPREIIAYLPHGIHWAGAVDQSKIEKEYAVYAAALNKAWKSGEGRIREGAVDTADWKVESGNKNPGTISADGLWESLDEHGFALLRAHAYVSVRNENRRGVIELRFVHNSVFEVAHVALVGALGEDADVGMNPGANLIQCLKRFMGFKMGYCTVFSNTATLDPTITVNFRGKYNSDGARKTFFLRDGVYGFD